MRSLAIPQDQGLEINFFDESSVNPMKKGDLVLGDNTFYVQWIHIFKGDSQLKITKIPSRIAECQAN